MVGVKNQGIFFEKLKGKNIKIIVMVLFVTVIILFVKCDD